MHEIICIAQYAVHRIATETQIIAVGTFFPIKIGWYIGFIMIGFFHVSGQFDFFFKLVKLEKKIALLIRTNSRSTSTIAFPEITYMKRGKKKKKTTVVQQY